MKKLLLWIVLLCSGSSALAQNGGDVVKESQDIIGNLDSLMNLWYLKHTTPIRNKKAANTYGFRPTDVPDYVDSIYELRLAKMASQSPLPYTYNEKVKAFINLYAQRKRDLVEKMLGLSDYYFPIYEEVFDKYDIPLEVRYLSVVESALNVQAVSKANAVGLWQFMYPTGKLYRLNVSSYIDERKDPYKSSVAAARYLRDLHRTFGDWFLAMAAYNCGPGNVNKAIRRSGGKKSFWEIYNYLPMETRGYVPAFIAASYVFQYHKEHNLYPQSIPLPTFVDTVVVNKELTFAPIAKVLKIDEALIRDLNPHFKKGYIPASPDQTYVLRLPSTKAYSFCQWRDSIYTCYLATNPNRPSTTTLIDAIQQDTEKTATASNSQSESATDKADPENPKVWVSYTVKPGDQLSRIADWFDVSVSNLKRWNRLRSNTVRRGSKLLVYVPAEQQKHYKKINIMTAAQKRRLGDKEQEEATTTEVAQKKPATNVKPQVSAPVQQEENASWYVVQKGDTLWSIAQRFPGVSVEDIKRVNNLTDHHSIRVGQKIKIAKG